MRWWSSAGVRAGIYAPARWQCARLESRAQYILTDVDAPKAEEIRRDETICLALADNKSQKYVSITGYAEIIDDRERVKEVWSIYDKAFWPDKNDPRIRILRVTPESAEFGKDRLYRHRRQIGCGDCFG